MPSEDAEATLFPSGEKRATQTPAVWPESVCRRWPDDAAHSFAVPSADAVARNAPSGDSATELTPRSCARNERRLSSARAARYLHSQPRRDSGASASQRRADAVS